MGLSSFFIFVVYTTPKILKYIKIDARINIIPLNFTKYPEKDLTKDTFLNNDVNNPAIIKTMPWPSENTNNSDPPSQRLDFKEV